MSGALVQLVSKGVQDSYIISAEGHSFFRTKFTRHTNFSQAPKFIKNVTSTDTSIVIPVYGDIINGIWLEASSRGVNIASKLFYNSTIDLLIGGQKVDSQHYDYFSDIWTNYLADTYTKSKELNTKGSSTNNMFLPLHFFFCDHKAFLPLIALQHHQVEIRITFDETNVATLSESEKSAKSLFWGYSALSDNAYNDRFTFSSVDLQINGTHLLERMTPVYFHTVQNYYKSQYGRSYFTPSSESTYDTRYFTYHFCLNASDYNPSGTLNFSRIDNASITLHGAEKGSSRPANQEISIYAVNYNVLRIRNGLAGILFGN